MSEHVPRPVTLKELSAGAGYSFPPVDNLQQAELGSASVSAG